MAIALTAKWRAATKHQKRIDNLESGWKEWVDELLEGRSGATEASKTDAWNGGRDRKRVRREENRERGKKAESEAGIRKRREARDEW